MRSPKIISGLAEIAGGYDGFIVDLWGCVHDGARPLPGAVEALDRLKALGKRVILLSNAPRRVEAVIPRLDVIGVPRRCYDGVMTSGEETWRHLLDRAEPFHAALGRRCLLIGPERDLGILDGVPVERVERVADADFILATGAEFGESVEDYETILRDGAALGLPMVCANPDLVVLLEGRPEICAGALAARYEALGGVARRHGKPDPAVYETCFALMPGIARRRVLGIGDALRTDMAGAAASGIDGLFLGGGIHGEALGVSVTDEAMAWEPLTILCDEIGVRPTFATPALRW